MKNGYKLFLLSLACIYTISLCAAEPDSGKPGGSTSHAYQRDEDPSLINSDTHFSDDDLPTHAQYLAAYSDPNFYEENPIYPAAPASSAAADPDSKVEAEPAAATTKRKPKKKEIKKIKICPICKKKFKHLGEHLLTHGKANYKCSACKKTTKLPQNIISHFIRLHMIKSWCKICNKKIKEANPREHTKLQHIDTLDERGTIDITSDTSNSSNATASHREEAKIAEEERDSEGEEAAASKSSKKSDPKKFERCPVCNLHYKRLSIHLKMHGEPKYKCSGCTKTSIDPLYIIPHFIHEHMTESFCNICNEKIEEGTTPREHARLQHIETLNKRKERDKESDSTPSAATAAASTTPAPAGSSSSAAEEAAAHPSAPKKARTDKD